MLPSGFWQKSSSFTVKLSACSSLEVTFFIRIPAKLQPFVPSLDFQHLDCMQQPEFLTAFVSPPTFFIFILSPQPLRPTTDFPILYCIFQWSQIPKYAVIGQEIHPLSSPKGTLFWSVHFSSSTSNKPNLQTKYITLLSSLRKWTLSYRDA